MTHRPSGSANPEQLLALAELNNRLDNLKQLLELSTAQGTNGRAALTAALLQTKQQRRILEEQIEEEAGRKGPG